MIDTGVAGFVVGTLWKHRAQANARLFVWLLTGAPFGVCQYNQANQTMVRRVAQLHEDTLAGKRDSGGEWDQLRKQIKEQIPQEPPSEECANQVAVLKLLLFLLNDNPLEAVGMAGAIVRLNFKKFASNPSDAQDCFANDLGKFLEQHSE
ncbi:MAG TPA: hypothetical protein VGP13_00775 [Candidatus Paceibacterota bacterium]|jgi:hypothetical protein|nr:hypothetical protein [Candidatus Paceibacterota bacterium]